MLWKILAREKEAILKRWLDLILSTYPHETKKFLVRKADRFANPVGSSIESGIAEIYDWLLKEDDGQTPPFIASLDKIVRIRAVQSFSPAAAVGFVFLLKHAVREVVAKEIQSGLHFEQLLTFESKIDKLSLLAFSIYMQCRETIFDIRATEIRDRTSRILERACRKYGMPSEWMDPEESDDNSVT
ncbi:MAG TPA: RsbRD N-terminal domain-containing protein [Desulfomonilaceae bacterium]|nr:RsbRD N-terminal domain-containing protein [Desulfomonilaceae bacterium]